MKYLITYTNPSGEYCEIGPMKISHAFDTQSELKAEGCVDVDVMESVEECER